jgi:predicted amidohydrolase YtcJ
MRQAMPDTLLINGNVIPMEERAEPTEGAVRPSAVHIRDGRVAQVGDTRDLLKAKPAGATVIDLEGRTLLPAFTDAHAHIWKMGHLLTTMLDLRGTESLEALVAAVRRRSETLAPGQWLLGRGFNEIIMPERRKPTRQDLDRAAPGRPVVLTRTCGHIYAVNTAALKAAGITAATAPPVGGVIERDESGEPNGLLHETAMGLINAAAPPPSSADYQAMIAAGLRHQLSLGITESSDCGVTPEILAAYLEMDSKGTLPARVSAMPLRRVDGRKDPIPLPAQHRSKMLRVDTVKFLADGGLSGATAALSVCYRHADTKGTLRFEPEDLRRLCAETQAAGWRIATHAIGDVAIDLILSVYESIGANPAGLRHRIEHFGLPDARQLQRAARMGIVSVPQTIFIRELGNNFIEMIPDSLFGRTYPIRAMLDAGLLVALSSDAPVVADDDPLSGMHAAITRRVKDGPEILPDERITPYEALRAYTLDGAVAAGSGSSRGSITPGKWADLTVLSGDPLAGDPDQLLGLRVEMTFLAGERVSQR